MSARILVVEDDELIGSSLSRALEANGYATRVERTCQGALDCLDSSVPDLVLLDLGLPDGDGTQVAVHVRECHPTVPVIVLSAQSEEADIVLGLQAGAVDYVVKPFRLAELLARISSHLDFRTAAADDRRSPAVQVDELTVDTATRRVVVGSHEIELRPKEFDVLACLAGSAGTVVTRDRLITEVWDENWWGSTKTLDVHISMLRRKLGETPVRAPQITSIRGVGYRLERDTS